MATAAQVASGHVFRPLNNRRELTGDTLLPQNIVEAVFQYGKRIGVPNPAPHDLHRTFAPPRREAARFLGATSQLRRRTLDDKKRRFPSAPARGLPGTLEICSAVSWDGCRREADPKSRP